MTEPISFFLDPLFKLLELFQKDRIHRDEKKDAVLLAIQEALSRTNVYLEKSKATKCFDRLEENEISNLWAQAAIKARHLSRDIALRLNDKSVYWSDELEWSREEVVRLGIDIPSIQALIRDLLSK